MIFEHVLNQFLDALAADAGVRFCELRLLPDLVKSLKDSVVLFLAELSGSSFATILLFAKLIFYLHANFLKESDSSLDSVVNELLWM